MICHVPLLLCTFACLLRISSGAEEFGPYAEPDFPVLTSTVDFSDWEKQGFPKNNIAVRGLIIKLPHDLYVCFDQDLLRVAGIWQGEPGREFLTLTTIPAISYNIPNKKSEPGQKDLPKPIGKPLMATGLMPGWILKAAKDVKPEDLKDPRPPGPDPDEPGRGPLPAPVFRWEGYRLEPDEVTLHYRCGATGITESYSSGVLDGEAFVWRHISLTGTEKPLSVVTGFAQAPRQRSTSVAGVEVLNIESEGRLRLLSAPATVTPERLQESKTGSAWPGWHPKAQRWVAGQGVTLTAGHASGGMIVENIPLPLPNQWNRNVRPSGIHFMPNDALRKIIDEIPQIAWIAFVCTIDGDVWGVIGGHDLPDAASWFRVASGLHEPQSILCKDPETIFVFTRDGIVRIGWAYFRNYENFCNAFTQTGESREYPMDMVAKPGGGFYIAKGGQMITRKTPQGGHVLEVSADGKTVTDICSGLRQPYLGIHPKTGILTASDQQGHWTPSTAIRYIRKGAYYGFEEAAPHPIPAVIDPPACWIPHEVNQSAAGQVWCVDAKMGPLNDRLLHLMYYKPGILTAFLDPDQKQAAVIPTGLSFDFPLLKGAINPADGLLYVCGFRIWGTESKHVGGLARVRPTGKPSTLPVSVRAVPQGIHVRFPDKLNAATCKAERFAAARWNYKRTSGYGSAHYNLDGTPGMEPLPCTGVQLSADGCGLLVHLPDMKPVEQIRIDWHLISAAGTVLESFACLTLYALVPFDAATAGFDPAFIPSAPGPVSAAAKEEPTMDIGKLLINNLGCLACHSIDGKMEGMKGPTWKDLFGSEVELTTGKKVTADAAWLRESILDPTKNVRKGFASADIGMPPYAGILSDSQVESVILYLRSLSVR